MRGGGGAGVESSPDVGTLCASEGAAPAKWSWLHMRREKHWTSLRRMQATAHTVQAYVSCKAGDLSQIVCEEVGSNVMILTVCL